MSEFTDYLKDVFRDLGDVRVRAMFGGHGVYLDDCMFGLVADDALYLKADAENVDFFEALDLPAFEFAIKSGKIMKMSFYLAPEEIYEDPDDTRAWVMRSWEAARRAKSAAKKVGSKKFGSKKTASKKSGSSKKKK